jgi:hypothetical protein
MNGGPDVTKLLQNRATGVVLTLAIVALTMTTSIIHFRLGGLLFTLNSIGYAGLAVLYVLGAIAPMALVERFSWFPRLALGGFAAMTIAGYLAIGPYFTLGWITKGVEVALITLILVDVIRVFGSPFGLVRAAWTSVFGTGETGTAVTA